MVSNSFSKNKYLNSLHVSVISSFSLVNWAERKLETEMVKVLVLHYWSTTYLLLSMKLLWLVYCLSIHVMQLGGYDSTSLSESEQAHQAKKDLADHKVIEHHV